MGKKSTVGNEDSRVSCSSHSEAPGVRESKAARAHSPKTMIPIPDPTATTDTSADTTNVRAATLCEQRHKKPRWCSACGGCRGCPGLQGCAEMHGQGKHEGRGKRGERLMPPEIKRNDARSSRNASPVFDASLEREEEDEGEITASRPSTRPLTWFLELFTGLLVLLTVTVPERWRQSGRLPFSLSAVKEDGGRALREILTTTRALAHNFHRCRDGGRRGEEGGHRGVREQPLPKGARRGPGCCRKPPRSVHALDRPR